LLLVSHISLSAAAGGVFFCCTVLLALRYLYIFPASSHLFFKLFQYFFESSIQFCGMSSKDSAFSVGLIERDTNGDHLCTWTFPCLSGELQNICVKRCETEGQNCNSFYFKYKSDWIYIKGRAPTKDCPNSSVEFFFVCVVAKIFNCEKFDALLNILTTQYASSGDPTKILEGYLSVGTTGKFSNAGGSFVVANYKDDQVSRFDSCVKNLVQLLGPEVVHIWNAVLLKKRVLIVGDDISQILQIVRSLPLLAAHRVDSSWSILRPIVRDEPLHVEDLAASGVFIAGTVDQSLSSRSELFEVIVTISNDEGRRISIPSHAQASMTGCVFHKEMANIVVELTENPTCTEKLLLEAISKKTTSILTQLRGLAEDGDSLSEAIINQRVTNKPAQQWLCRLATAEGWM
jgi:hypothetical protein